MHRHSRQLRHVPHFSLFFLLDILSLTASRQQRHGNPQQAADAALTQRPHTSQIPSVPTRYQRFLYICTTSAFRGTRGFVSVHPSAIAPSAMWSMALKYSSSEIVPICDMESGISISFNMNCTQFTSDLTVMILL